jgi:hypothetical protein
MIGFKRCNNGHMYKEDMSKCPYCPNGSSSSGSAGGENDFNKTQIFSNHEDETVKISLADKTEFVSQNGPGANLGSSDRTEHIVQPTPSQAKKSNFDRTFIQGVEETPNQDGDSDHIPVGAPRATRKMVGWLVSYTLDDMGVDYRLYEGNNTIGRDTNNSIIIKQDSVISSKHINILFRKDRYWIRDEMSANGTLLNGEDLDLDKVYELHDGDLIKIGNTTFKFKSSL